MSARQFSKWRLAVIAHAALVGAIVLPPPALQAQAIDYDPRRPMELRPCDDHRHHGRGQQARECYAQLLDASNAITQAEAAWAVGEERRANELFRALAMANARAVQPRVRWGRLFLQTHQYGDAAAMFREALEISPNDVQAKLGLARVFAERFEGEARALVDAALKQDADLIEGQLLIGRMSLEEGQFDAASAALDRAAQIARQQNQAPLEVHSLRAALELARGRSPEPWVRRALDYNPKYGSVYEQLAYFEVVRRRYRAAMALLRRAVELQPDLWSAHAELGLNLLRFGEIEAARTHLTAAYAGDPYSPTIVNSLRLLDRIDEFELSTTPVSVRGENYELRLRLHRQEAAVLGPYATDLARQAIDTFSRRYAFRLREPVTVEMYPDHDDFAVRVAALPGIGLLGVTFGYVVAMDSPSGRAAGDFHWGSTMWHELAHVFTLEATDHRVPRWLSEGISVFEEWRTGPTPGVAVPPETIVALRDGRLLPVSELDAGFIRPTYPGQVQVSYVQAGLVCLFIEQRWGFDRVVALLQQFVRETSTPAAIEATLRISPADFDREFNAFLRTRFAALLAGMDEWQRSYEAARRAIESEQWSAAIEPARRAAQLYPEHAGPGSPNLLLAQALDRIGRRQEAIAAMEAYRASGGWDPDALRQLARWLDEAGRAPQATSVLRALNYADPRNPAQHAQLGERLLDDGHPQASLQEFRVQLALERHDPAPALYGAARALRASGDREASRRYVLDALAAAPHYRPAQALLLQMIEERNHNE